MWISKTGRRLGERTGSIARVAALVTVLACAMAAAPPVFAAAAQLNATLQPDRISLDEAAQLSLTLHGMQEGEPVVPQVNGLTFTPLAQSSSTESINGVTTYSVSLTYRVTAQHPGRYTIPSLQFQGARTSPLSLDVLPARSAAAGGSGSPGGSLPPPTLGGGATWSTDSDRQGVGRKAFLRCCCQKSNCMSGNWCRCRSRPTFVPISASVSMVRRHSKTMLSR